MDDNIFKYMLEITGLDNRIHSDANGNFIPHMEFKETNYFLTLCETVESLLLTDIRKFERQSGETDSDRYCEYAAIRAIEAKEPLLEIFRLSFEATLKGSPAAGIYMHFCDSTTEKFERLTGYDLSGFSAYDPNSPFLQLASYAYDKGFKIFIDEALSNWVHGLKYYELGPEFPEEWNYKTSVIQTSLGASQSNEITNYHYQNLSDAVSQLLQIEITRLDQQLARKSESKSWISKADITKRGKDKLVEFVTAKDNSSREVVSEQGIYLKLYLPIKELEQESGIDLSRLGIYNHDDKHLLVANYDKYHTKLLPYPGYPPLLTSIDNDHMLHKHAGEKEPYLLQITWELTQYANGDDSLFKQQQVKNIPCSSVDEALSGMKELDIRFFDEHQAYRQHYPLYVKQADIIDSSNSTVIVSKFQVKEEGEQLPVGIYMKLNENYVSMELLKLLRSHLTETQGNSHHLLITDTKSLRLPLSEETLERRSKAAKRTINSRGGPGLKM